MTARATDLVHKGAAEFIGTGFLVGTVVGSGVMAARLSPDDVGLQLLHNSVATGAVLVALILALQPVSAAFNPVVSAVEAAVGLITWTTAGVLAVAQVAGGVLGAVVANLMFDLDAVSLASTQRSGSHLWLAEVVATFGLVLVIFGALHAGRADAIAYAVGAYIVAAYWFTSSTSFANPAVTLGRTLSDTFTGISPSSAPMYVLMQAVGGALAYVVVRLLHPSLVTSPSPSSPPSPPGAQP